MAPDLILLEQQIGRKKWVRLVRRHIIASIWLLLQTEFGTPLGQIQVALEEHKRLKCQVETLQRENAKLLAELEKSGTISDSVR